MKILAKEAPSDVAQAALDAGTGVFSQDRLPITRAEAEAVLKRFRLIDLLNLVVEQAARTSDRMSMTVESSIPGTKVVVRVTHPRVKKSKG